MVGVLDLPKETPSPLGMVRTLTSKSLKKFGVPYQVDNILLSQVLFWQTNPSQQQQVF